MGVSRPLPHQADRLTEELRQGTEAQRRQSRTKANLGTLAVTQRPPDAAAATEGKTYLLCATRDVVVLDVQLVAESTVVANASNYADISLEVFQNDTSATKAGLVTTRSENLPAGQARGFDLSGTVHVPRGQMLRLLVQKVGTGVALPLLMVQVTYREKAV